MSSYWDHFVNMCPSWSFTTSKNNIQPEGWYAFILFDIPVKFGYASFEDCPIFSSCGVSFWMLLAHFIAIGPISCISYMTSNIKHTQRWSLLSLPEYLVIFQLYHFGDMYLLLKRTTSSLIDCNSFKFLPLEHSIIWMVVFNFGIIHMLVFHRIFCLLLSLCQLYFLEI